jgi:hypothetical protein
VGESHGRAYLAAQLIVVAISLTTTGGLLAFEDPSVPPAPVVISSVHWTEKWANNSTSASASWPTLDGSCIDASLLNTSGANLTCWLVTRPYSVGTDGSGAFTAVPIVSVAVDSPFTLIAQGQPVLLYGCLDCRIDGLTIGLPATGGTYELTGTVYFGLETHS